MKVINLDQFKTQQAISLDGTEYSVRGITVDEFINETVKTKLESAKSAKESAEITIALLMGMTDIPEAVLRKQNFKTLMAIIQVAQGIDPTQEDAEGDEKK